MKSKKVVKVEKQVEKLASLGLTNIEIGDVLGYDDSTLKRNFENNLTKGRIVLKRRLKQKQIQVALKGNVAMLIWLGKQYLDQKDRMEETGDYNLNVTRTRLEDKLIEEGKKLEVKVEKRQV